MMIGKIIICRKNSFCLLLFWSKIIRLRCNLSQCYVCWRILLPETATTGVAEALRQIRNYGFHYLLFCRPSTRSLMFIAF